MFEYAKHLSEEDTDPGVHTSSAQYLKRESVQGSLDISHDLFCLDLFQGYNYEEPRKTMVHSPSKADKDIGAGSKSNANKSSANVKSLNSSLYQFVEKNRNNKRRLGLDNLQF